MTFNVNFSFDDSKLKELQRKAKELDKENKIPLTELLPDDFIKKYTDFDNLQTMMDTSGIKKLEETDNPEFSKFISIHTKFSSWKEMLDEASKRYFKQKLGL